MRYVLIILLLFISNVHAALIGSGTASFGLSHLQDTTEVGADLNYQLSADSKNQKTKLSLITVHSSDSSNLPLSNDHRRLYSGDKTSISVENYIPLTSSLVNWVTKSNFNSEKLSLISTENESWNLNTGPEYKKSLRQDLLLEVGIKAGSNNVNNSRSYSTDSNVGMYKSVTKNKKLGIKIRNVCLKYKNGNEIDSCHELYGFTMGMYTSNSIIDLEAGISIINQTNRINYSANYNYRFNENSNISFSLTKESSNTEAKENLVTLESLNAEIVTVDSKKIEYIKKLARTSVTLRHEDTRYSLNDRLVEVEKISDIKISHKLNSYICRSCSVIFLNKRNQINEYEWEIFALGTEYLLSRNIILNMMFRQSKDEILGEYKSLNLQIRYNGTDQHLALN